MYYAQITKERIKSLCKEKKSSMDDMLSECSLGVNAIRQINDTKGMSSFSLARIADYLNCSVDYLLGRTDNTELNSERNLSEQEKKILDAFRSTDELGRMRIIQSAMNEFDRISSYKNMEHDTDSLEDLIQMQNIEGAGAAIAAETEKNTKVKTPDIDTIIELNKDEF